jgi:hypothetical protein
MPASSRKSRRKPRAGTIRLFLLLSLLVGINVYFLGFRGGTSIGALLRSNRVHQAPSEAGPLQATAKQAPLPEDPPGARVVDGLLGDGQTIGQALTPRLGRKLAAQLEEALATELDLGAVRAGQPYVLVYDLEDRLVAFEFRAAPGPTYRVELSAGKPTLSVLTGRAETRVVELTLPVGPAIWEALRRAGEGSGMGERLCELYAAEGDLCGPGASAGERVRVLAEKRLLGGRPQRYGKILGAEWVTRAGVRRAFFSGGAEPGYYTERGDAVARAARVTPFRATRNLVHGRAVAQRPSEGVLALDYGAATGGGLVMACAIAAGTVTGITRAPTGTSVTVLSGAEHHTYAHLGRLARGLQLGQKVEQGQALGRAENGLLLTVDGEAAARSGHLLAARAAPLAAAERPRFGELIAPLLERLRGLALRPSDPLAQRGLSAIP